MKMRAGKFLSLLLVIMMPLAGCAVMKVDVDVYKGPLANHEDVQTEQMAVMAIGAKPLLLELRDTLLEKTCIDNLKNAQKYKDGFIEPDYIYTAYNQIEKEKNKPVAFKNALRVNAVLSLYYDLSVGAVRDYLKNSKNLIEKYDLNFKVLYPNKESDEKFWERYKNNFYTSEKEIENHPALKGITDIDTKKAFWDYYDNLKKEYEGFHNPVKNSKMRTHIAIIKNAEKGIKTDDTGEKRNINNYEKIKDIIKAYDLPAYSNLIEDEPNELFQLMASDERIASAHARFLFEGQFVEKKDDFYIRKFSDRTIEIAKSYIELRTISEEFFRQNLEFIAAINLPPLNNEVKKHGLTQHAIDIGISLLNSVNYSYYLTRNDRKDAFCNSFPDKGGCGGSIDLLVKLKQKATEKNTGSQQIEESQKNQEAIDYVKSLIRDKIKKSPALEASNMLTEHVGYISHNKFGFARATFENQEETRKIFEEIKKNYDEILTLSTGVGLDHGRLDDGLEKLIDDYLKKVDSRRRNNGRSEACEINGCTEERDRLIDELVRFAEKVLFLANNSQLLEDENSASSWPNEYCNEYRDCITIDGNINKKKINHYTMVLQAVGNSILNQADEFHHKKTFKKGLTDRWQIEMNALISTFSKNASDVQRLIVGHLDTEKEMHKDSVEFFLKQVNSAKELLTSPLSDTDIKAATAVLETIDDQGEINSDKANQVEKLKKLASDFTDKADMPAYTEKQKDTLNKISKMLDRVAGDLNAVIKDRREFANLNTAIGVIQEFDGWAKEQGNTSVNASDFISRLTGQINKKISTTAGAEPDKYKIAADMLRTRSFSIASLGDIDALKDKDPRQALDQLISTLRYQLVQEIQANGADSPMALHISDAIKAASVHRSGMIYIRPAGAYLRNSYPSTSLQNDAELTWKNMLGVQSGRAIFRYDSSNHYDNKRRNEIINEIDKQFWQNINSVRVAGGGDTNYVVAKDDIGNWYVKAYSTDPGPIIESAKNLAMYNLGTSLKVDMMSRLPEKAKKPNEGSATQGAAQEAGGTATASNNNDVERTAFEKLLDKHTEKYDEKTKRDIDELINDLSNDGAAITGQIIKAWTENEDIQKTKRLSDSKEFDKILKEKADSAAKQTLTPAHDELTKIVEEAKKDSKKKDGYGTSIIDTLSTIKRFNHVLVRYISGIHITDGYPEAYEDAKGDYETAKADLDKLNAELAAMQNSGTDEEKKAKQTAIKSQQQIVEQNKKKEEEAQFNLEKAKRAERIAEREASRIIRENLNKYVERRNNAVDDLKTSIVFIGDALTN